jgi:hypothetical protein
MSIGIMDINLLSINDFKGFINSNNQISPKDITISMLYYIEVIINNGMIMHLEDKFKIIISIFILTCKYLLSHDCYFSVENNSLYCGITIEEYIKYEYLILNKLDWKLEIPKSDYIRLGINSSDHLTMIFNQ